MTTPRSLHTEPVFGLRVAADGHEISVQPLRFSRTGPGLAAVHVRDEFVDDAMSYALDAPPLIPRGSTMGYLHRPTLLSLQPWHYIDTADTRP